MSDIIKFCLIIYGCISLSLLITYLQELDVGKAFAMFLFWPIYLIVYIVQAIIYDIKNV